MKKLLGTILVLALVLSFSVVATTPVAAQTTWYVDGTNGSNDPAKGTGPGSDAFATIQYAIDHTGTLDGHTIEVAAGTYTEQITVDKNLTILGIDNPTIEAPASAARTTRTISGSGTRVLDWVVLFENVEEFAFDGFIVDGEQDGTSVRFVGILAGNAAGTISGNEVINVRGPEGGTGGIVVYGEDSVVDIVGNDVRDFRKNGITAISDATVSIVGNKVVGDGPIDTIAQNGIQIGFGATGEIIDNEVSAILYDAAGWASCGILVIGADDVVVKGNEVYDCREGIYLTPLDWGTVENSIVRGNEVRNCVSGIIIYYTGVFTGDRLIEDNELFGNNRGISLYDAEGWLVKGNTVDGSTTRGIGVLGACSDNTVEYNTITNNAVGVLVGNDGYGDPVNTVVRFNDIEGNADFGVEVWDVGTPNVVGATLNWWGDASGPTHATNPDGTGDGVSDNVDFTPWYFMVDPDPDIPITSYGELDDTATGTGPAKFGASQGTIENLRSVDEADLPAEGKPNLQFPHGFFALDIDGVTPHGGTVIVSIMLPQPARPGTQYWKYYNDAWHQIPMTIDPNDSRIIHITLVDGLLGDADGEANGTIIDQGGPGNPVTVGWEGSSVNKAAVMAPWLALFAAMIAGVLLMVRRRRAQVQV